MIEQRLATSQQKLIGPILGFFYSQFTWFDTIGANAPGFDHSLIAQASKRAECSSPRNFELSSPRVSVKITCDVVYPHKIQAIYAEPPKAVFDRSQCTIFRVVVYDSIWTPVLEEVAFLAKLLRLGFNLVQDYSANFRAKHVIVPLVFRQRLTQADFGETSTVEGRRVEITCALLPRGINCCFGLLVENVAEHISQGCCSEAQGTSQQAISDIHNSSRSVSAALITIVITVDSARNFRSRTSFPEF